MPNLMLWQITMTYPPKKRVILSPNMDYLKTKIKEDKEKQKSYTEKVHNGGKLAQYLVEGLQKTLGLIRPFLKAFEEVSILGFALQMLAVIPNAVITLTDEKSSRLKKFFALLVLLTTTGLGVTAFVLGGVVAAGIGLGFASLGTLFAGLSFIASLFNKSHTRKAYQEKKEFIELIQNRDIASLDNDLHREQLEIRALELEQLLEKSSDLSAEKEELAFINKIRSIRKYESPQVDNRMLRLVNLVRKTIGLSELPPEENPVTKLSKLYVTHKSYVVYLAAVIKIIDHENESDPLLIDLVSTIQHHIAKIDKDIERITKPLHQLEQKNQLANQTIVKSYTNLALGSIGLILSTIGLMALLGTLVMPPVMGTILFGFGIGLAVFGAIKWGVELYVKRENEKLKKGRREENEENILEEALNSYDLDLSQRQTSSYATKLQPIFNLKTTTAPEKSENSVDMIEMKEIITKEAATSEPINLSQNSLIL